MVSSVSLLAAASILAACQPKPGTVATGPVETRAEAEAIAAKALSSIEGAGADYRVEQQPGVWMVHDGPSLKSHHTVVIDAATGRWKVGYFAVAYINEEL